MNFRLESKKDAVFKRMIHEYIRSAKPVGSKIIAQKKGLDLSSATIRNYFAEFEDWGLVSQPHPSAGRVPTDLGFRYYVNHLTRPAVYDEESAAAVRGFFQETASDLENLTRQTPKILSQLSRQIGLLARPKLEGARLKEIHFLRLDAKRILAIFIFQNEMVENRVLRNQAELGGFDLHRLSNYLNQIGRGKTLLEVRNSLLDELKAQGRNQSQEMKRLWELSEELIRSQTKPGLEIDGESNLANNPEFNQPQKLEPVLKLLEDQRILLDLVDQSLSLSGVKVTIGSEHPYPEMRELAMITTNYLNREGRPLGSIGIIGPKRIDYEKLISLVSCLARMISEYLRMH